MRCNLCGKEYAALGVHLHRKHKVDLNDYREEYGMLRTAPLVDPWLSERMRDSQVARLKDPEYTAELVARCVENSVRKLGANTPGFVMSSEGKARLVRRNAARNAARLSTITPLVHDAWANNACTLLDVRASTKTGPLVAKRILGSSYDKGAAIEERQRRGTAALNEKRQQHVAQVLSAIDPSWSGAELCRRAGISHTTYKRWVAAGWIPRCPDGRTNKCS